MVSSHIKPCKNTITNLSNERKAFFIYIILNVVLINNLSNEKEAAHAVISKKYN